MCVCVCVCLSSFLVQYPFIHFCLIFLRVCVCVFSYILCWKFRWSSKPNSETFPLPLPHWFPMIYKIRHHNWPKDKTDRRYALVSPWWNYSYRLCAATLWMTCERLETKPRDLGLALWLNWTFLLYFLSLSLSLCFFLLFVLSIICFLFGFFFPSSLYLNFFMTNNFLYFVLAKNFFFLSVWTRMVCTL